MSARTTSNDPRGFGNKILDSHSIEFLSTRRTGGGTNILSSGIVSLCSFRWS